MPYSAQKYAMEQLARSHQKAVTLAPSNSNAVRATSVKNSKAINKKTHNNKGKRSSSGVQKKTAHDVWKTQ